MTITDFNYESSYLPGLTCNMDVTAHIGRSTPILASRGQEWQFHIYTVKSSYWQINWQIYPTSTGILWSRMAILHFYC